MTERMKEKEAKAKEPQTIPCNGHKGLQQLVTDEVKENVRLFI